MKTWDILLAEDNEGDVYLVQEALQSRGLQANLIVQEDGEKMLEYLARIGEGELPSPDIVLLDLNLPKRDGETVLTHLRLNPKLKDVPVVIVTSSNAPRDREATARLGANSYFRKPLNFDEFMELGDTVKALLQ